MFQGISFLFHFSFTSASLFPTAFLGAFLARCPDRRYLFIQLFAFPYFYLLFLIVALVVVNFTASH